MLYANIVTHRPTSYTVYCQLLLTTIYMTTLSMFYVQFVKIAVCQFYITIQYNTIYLILGAVIHRKQWDRDTRTNINQSKPTVVTGRIWSTYITAAIRRPMSVTSSRACSPHTPEVSMANGEKSTTETMSKYNESWCVLEHWQTMYRATSQIDLTSILTAASFVFA